MTRKPHLAQTILSNVKVKQDPALNRSALEPLESRRLLSGNVTASVANGSLTLSGDGESNAIVLDQAGLNADQVRVTGTGGTTINDGAEPVIMSGITRAVGMHLGDGDDSLVMRDVSLPGDVWLNGDAGANTLALNDVQTAGTVYIGHDSMLSTTIAIADSTIDGYLHISTGSGGHNVALQAVEVKGKTKIGSQDGADVITVNDSTLHGDVTLYTGNGDDSILIETLGAPTGPTTLFNGRVGVVMKAGEDTLQLGVLGQEGNQSVFASKAKFDGGSGEDTIINLDASTHLNSGRLRVKSFETSTSTTDTDTDTDTTAPTLSSTSPANGATDVARNKKIAATFSEAMDPATMTDANVTVTAGGVPVDGSVAYAGRTMTFTPATLLAADTVYTTTISTGATDAAGNALADDVVWSFTTGSTSDVTAPTVSSTDPEDDATGVAFNKKVTATFDEEMDPLTISTDTVTVTGPGGTPVSGTVGYAGDIMTFTPASPLAPNATYTATISIGAEDLAGNALASAFVWSFTTGVTADTTAPTVTSTNPADLTTNVALNKAIAATFNEPMDPLTIAANYVVTDPSDAAVDGTVSYNSATRTATFTPSSNLAPNTTYTATVNGGTNGVEDSAGNALANDEVWSFTTGTQIAQAPINLGRAAPFAVMATASISGTGNSIVGDVGLNPGTAQGIPPSEIDGDVHVTNQTIIDAQTDLLEAYNDAVSRTVTSQTLPGNMGGLTFTPGLYTNSSSVMISGAGPANNVTLDAQGDENAIFIFKMSSTLSTGPGAQVILAGGAKASNVFWQVGTSATLDTTTIFKGNILAAVSITVNSGSDVTGRLLGGSNTDGSVTVDASTVTVPAA